MRVLLIMGLVAVLAACGQTPRVELRPSEPAVSYAPLRHPFRDRQLYLAPDSPALRWQNANGASWLDPITRTPQAVWLNSPQDLDKVPALVSEAGQQDALPVLVAYYVPNRGCSDFRDGAPTPAEYVQWVDRLITLLGATKAVVVMEPDAIPADCFTTERAEVLKAAVGKLSEAGHFVYLDAGHSRWRSTGETAERLIAAGVNVAEGFAVNISNRQSTEDAHKWGRELADLTGDREFVIDTSRNGLGPPPGDGDSWCNPEQQGLGEPPTTKPALEGVAALLWIKPPGESDGICGGEDTYLFSPRQARNLIMRSPHVPPEEREAAATH
ncbi:glucanase [Lentzea sp. NBRC 105346]|uniref:glycoside hydrolase family 6 protein n=1 Tax=Lentzea sp. NBRC 105346 TaxID=3032205 RepID=UPI0024A0B1BB|nr:glycoside hydrolase family 6 protein [Lentzea sp. NBRC 105346]GLZ28252.1 glucanase [Lentzea sp. NBRC 105346]